MADALVTDFFSVTAEIASGLAAACLLVADGLLTSAFDVEDEAARTGAVLGFTTANGFAEDALEEGCFGGSEGVVLTLAAAFDDDNCF